MSARDRSLDSRLDVVQYVSLTEKLKMKPPHKVPSGKFKFKFKFKKTPGGAGTRRCLLTENPREARDAVVIFMRTRSALENQPIGPNTGRASGSLGSAGLRHWLWTCLPFLDLISSLPPFAPIAPRST